MDKTLDTKCKRCDYTLILHCANCGEYYPGLTISQSDIIKLIKKRLMKIRLIHEMRGSSYKTIEGYDSKQVNDLLNRLERELTLGVKC